MKDISFKITEDGSVGLYDFETKDILHSITGAYRESYDKFIDPCNISAYYNNESEVNILDICFGIGYNTKSAINEAIKNNSKSKINISALEINKEIAFLSPFIKDGIENISVDIFLLNYFLNSFQEYAEYIETFLKDNHSIVKDFFRKDICLIFENYLNYRYSNSGNYVLLEFLHNIYYQNISMSMKNDLKAIDSLNLFFELKIGDARQTIKELNMDFHSVFLDGYTPHKQPLLWTWEFLSILKSKLKSNGILATYSNSTPVRMTLLDIGLNVGKIILDGKQFGTIATKDKDKIKYHLSQYDYGLMNTKAGIPYRDFDLNQSSKEILKQRNMEVANSSKISATKYKKGFNNEI